MEEEKAGLAKARGEGLREELLTMLRNGPQTAVALLSQIEMADVSLSEVTFQLERLADERRAAGVPGGSYRLVSS